MFHILSVINCSFYFVVLLSLIRVFVIVFIEQYQWFGFFSTVHSCLFLMCATDRPSSMNSSIVLCYNINKLTYLGLLAGFVKVSEWCEVMSSIFTMELPWHSLRSKLAKLNSAGLVDYRSTFDDFKLHLKHNPEVRICRQWTRKRHCGAG